jgi:two-component system, LytTR family, response regulator
MESRYTCLVVDDEYPAHDVITTLLKSYPNLEYKKSCYNGQDALNEINEKNYDIVFLDVNMPIINGIEMLQKLQSKPAIIMTTAYTSFAFEAYEYDAVDYLQKPIAPERFQKAISKAIEYAQKRKTSHKKFILLKIDGLQTKINQDDIQYIRSMENYSKFYIINRTKPILLKEAFSKQLEKLNLETFIQTHRTCIVNKKFIIGKKENDLLISDDSTLPIGRKYIPEINKLLLEKK